MYCRCKLKNFLAFRDSHIIPLRRSPEEQRGGGGGEGVVLEKLPLPQISEDPAIEMNEESILETAACRCRLGNAFVFAFFIKVFRKIYIL